MRNFLKLLLVIALMNALTSALHYYGVVVGPGFIASSIALAGGALVGLLIIKPDKTV